MATMSKSAVLVAPRKIEIQEIPIPDTGDDDGILRIEATGVCGADWGPYTTGESPGGAPMPKVLGHEIVGRIERVGKNAAVRWGVKEGDRVAMEEYIPCGRCDDCFTGHYNFCNSRWYGMMSVTFPPALWGGYSEYLYLDPNSIMYPMADSVPKEIAPFFLPLGNGVRWATTEGGVGIGSTIVILGPGGQGMGSVVAAKEAGAGCIIVTGLSSDARRLEIAKEMGADYTIVADEQDVVQQVSEITGGKMADTVVNVTANAPQTVQQALEVAGKRATVVLAGIAHGEVPGFTPGLINMKELTIKGVRGRRMNEVRKAIHIMESGKYPLEKVMTHHFPVEQTDLAIRTMGKEGEPGALHVAVMGS